MYFIADVSNLLGSSPGLTVWDVGSQNDILTSNIQDFEMECVHTLIVCSNEDSKQVRSVGSTINSN